MTVQPILKRSLPTIVKCTPIGRRHPSSHNNYGNFKADISLATKKCAVFERGPENKALPFKISVGVVRLLTQKNSAPCPEKSPC